MAQKYDLTDIGNALSRVMDNPMTKIIRSGSIGVLGVVNPVAGIVGGIGNDLLSEYNTFKLGHLLNGLASGFNLERRLNELYNYVNSSPEKAIIVANLFKQTVNAECPKVCVIYGLILANHLETLTEFTHEELIVCKALENATDYDLKNFKEIMENYLKPTSNGRRIVFPKDFADIAAFTTTCDWCVYNRIFVSRTAEWGEMEEGILDMSTYYYEANPASVLLDMPAQVTNYKCPTCTGPLHFVGASGKLECDYCGASYDVAQIEALYAEKEGKAAAAQQSAEEKAAAEKTAAEGSEWDMSDLSTDWGAEGEGMKAYNCPSCGAQLICDATTAATSCPYCGNPTVVPGQFAGTLKPDFVIPFKLSREDAVQRLKQHYKGKVFLPKSFSSENHLQEISGVYVPFWMFSGEAEGDAHFDATRSRTYKSGDYRITETDHYDAYRAGSLAFEKIPVDGSEKMPDEHMDSIEPYDYSELKPFSTAYLPGFLADKFDVTAEDSRQRADSRCAGTLRSALEKTVSGYETCSARESNTTIKRGKVHYALMPVWMLNTKWRGKDFLFAMNGQTGKFVGDLPVDKGRYWAMFFAIAVPLSAIGSFLAMTLLR